MAYENCSCGLDIMITNVLCFIHAWNWMMNGGTFSALKAGCLVYIYVCHDIWWLLSGCPVHRYLSNLVIHLVRWRLHSSLCVMLLRFC